jgi:prepilin-type N-terminal cleavage/methylation domain-containing protein
MKRSGFTLIELVVVISIVAILASVVIANVNEASKKSRDADRQADLRTLQSAIELYKGKYGRYPAGCNAAGTWSGQTGTAYACSSGNQYIVGLAPEFIPVLPQDPKINGSTSGYVYTTNIAGTVYKLMAKNTVEAETVTATHPFRSCEISSSGQVPCSASTEPPDPVSAPMCDVSICDRVHNSYSLPPHCDPNTTLFQKTYAVWGGYASNPSLTFVARLTEDIICEIP